MIIPLGGRCPVPKQIPGLAFWFDGQDPNGNRNLPSSGAAVATWIDKSGRGNHVTQGVGSQQAIFTSNAINGFPAMRFSPATLTRYLSSPLTDFYGINSYSIFSVVRISSFATANSVIIYSEGIYVQIGSPGNIRLVHSSPFGGATDNAVGTNGTIAINTNYICHFRRSASNNSMTTTSNTGITYTLTPLARPALPSTAMAITIGTNPLGAGTNTFNGFMGEILGYIGDLSTADINSRLAYLSNKWGIAQ